MHPFARVVTFGRRSRTALSELFENGNSPGSGVVDVLCTRPILLGPTYFKGRCGSR